jgi:hypothetical protein
VMLPVASDIELHAFIGDCNPCDRSCSAGGAVCLLCIATGTWLCSLTVNIRCNLNIISAL